MTQHPLIEALDLLTDERYPGFRQALLDERDRYDKRMRRLGCDPRVMDRCAGAIEALDFALGKPEQMKDTSPVVSVTPPGDPA